MKKIMLFCITLVSIFSLNYYLYVKNHVKPIPTKGRLIGYLPGWKTPPRASSVARAGYTHLIVAFAVFDNHIAGKLSPSFDQITQQDIKLFQSYGIKVMLSIGGPSTGLESAGVDFHKALSRAASPAIFEKNMRLSMEYFIQTYGFDGFDIDIEKGLTPGGTFENPEGDIRVLATIINEFHRTHPKHLISLTPQVENIAAHESFNAMYGNYASLIMQTHAALSWVGIQLYNSGCAYGLDHVCYEPQNIDSPNFYVAVATDVLTDWPAQIQSGQATGFKPYLSYLKPSQVVLGFYIPTPKGNFPTVPFSVIKRAMRCLNTAVIGQHACADYVPPKAYLGMGGIFGWEVTYDAENDYQFAKSLRDCAVSQECN